MLRIRKISVAYFLGLIYETGGVGIFHGMSRSMGVGGVDLVADGNTASVFNIVFFFLRGGSCQHSDFSFHSCPLQTGAEALQCVTHTIVVL
jgi:hypothetical protein